MIASTNVVSLIDYEKEVHEREQDLRKGRISLKDLLALLLSRGGAPLFARIISHESCEVARVFDTQVKHRRWREEEVSANLFERLFGSPLKDIKFTPGTGHYRRFIEDGKIDPDDAAAIRSFDRICRSVIKRVKSLSQ